MITRRGALIGGGLAALAAGWQVWGVRPEPLAFKPIKSAPGWQFAFAGSVSGAVDPTLIGIRDTTAVPLPDLPSSELRAAVYGKTPRQGHAPIAVFSDFFCPYCRILFARLFSRSQRAASPVTIAWHELPLLRPESHIAARASEAANLQNGYAVFQEALIARGFRPAPIALSRIAAQAGLDPQRFLTDMQGAEVTARLKTSARAAQTLGVFATPGLVIGQNVILGAVSDDQLDALITDHLRNAA